MSSIERRQDARFAVSRPIKCQCAQTGKYLTGRTRNLSASGALLELDHPSLLVPGQIVRMGIAWTKQQTVLATGNLLEGVVVRSLGLGNSQQVAVTFAHKQSLAMAG